jgi:hypothetical protein
LLLITGLLLTFRPLLAADQATPTDLEFLTLSVPDRPHAYLPNVTRLADGTIICGYSAGDNWKMTAINTITSRDVGRSWSPPVTAMKVTGGYIADTNFLVLDDRVTLFATFVPDTTPAFARSEFHAADSDDNGKTWSPARKLKTPHTYVTGKVHSPVRLRDGTWVMGYSWELGAEAGRGAGSEPAMRVKAGVLRSKDNGLTWKPGDDVWVDEPMGPDEPALVLLKNDDLFAIFRTGGTHPYEARSSDGGQSWSPLRRSQFEGHNSPTSLLRLKDGSILRLWNHSPKNRYPLVASISTDECVTWSPPKTITDPTRDKSGKLSFEAACYPSAAQAEDGTIVITWWETGDSGFRIRAARFPPAWVKR